jgi:hypothetical protein
MGRLLSGLTRGSGAASALLPLLAALLQPSPAMADGFDASADVLGVSSNGTRSYLDNGLGDLRFDSDHQGLQLDNLRVGYRGSAFDIVHFTVEAVSYGDRDSNPIDLTEAFAEIRPFPMGLWRSRLKIGAFYAPISLENRLTGWRSAYSLSPSAINTWVGEELRTFGAEYDLDWLGRQRGHDWELGVGGSVYGWNESTGQLLADRGWAIDDRQSTLFGKIGDVGHPVNDERLMTSEGANRAGYYIDATAKYLDALELRALHYDNRADTAQFSEATAQFPWLTQFDSAGARWTPTDHWTVISQWLSGKTCVQDEDERYCWHFSSEFLLLSWQLGADRLTGRFDRFNLHPPDQFAAFENIEANDGHAWTLSYQRDVNRYLSAALEYLQIDSRVSSRLQLGVPEMARERQIELALRLHL